HKGSASNLKYLTRVRNVNVESEQSEDSLTKRSYPDWALTKDRTRTGRSQKIAPGLEASNQVRDVKPGPERSEGAPSQKIGRELEAYNIGRKC
ncbi:MAG: hypothetical protein ACLQS0_07785, partial [Syntrophobacteraceae bacterium]